MKKLLLAASVSALAVAAGPAAAASAADNSFGGSCSIKGIAKFDKPLMGGPSPNGYQFNGEGTCDGTLNGKSVSSAPIEAYVKGEGNLSCAVATSTKPGQGYVTFTKGTGATGDDTTITATLEFTGGGSEVAITVKGTKSGEARGRASFLTSAKPETPSQCEGADGGVKELGFEAAFTTLSPLTSAAGAAPTAPSPGGGQPGGGGTAPEGGGEAGGGASLLAKPQSLKAAIKRGIKAACIAEAPASCSLVAQISASTAKRLGMSVPKGEKYVTIGRGKAKLSGSGQQRATTFIRLTAEARKALAGKKSVRVRIAGTVTNASGKEEVTTSTTLKR